MMVKATCKSSPIAGWKTRVMPSDCLYLVERTAVYSIYKTLQKGVTRVTIKKKLTVKRAQASISVRQVSGQRDS